MVRIITFTAKNIHTTCPTLTRKLTPHSCRNEKAGAVGVGVGLGIMTRAS